MFIMRILLCLILTCTAIHSLPHLEDSNVYCDQSVRSPESNQSDAYPQNDHTVQTCVTGGFNQTQLDRSSGNSTANQVSQLEDASVKQDTTSAQVNQAKENCTANTDQSRSAVNRTQDLGLDEEDDFEDCKRRKRRQNKLRKSEHADLNQGVDSVSPDSFRITKEGNDTIDNNRGSRNVTGKTQKQVNVTKTKSVQITKEVNVSKEKYVNVTGNGDIDTSKQKEVNIKKVKDIHIIKVIDIKKEKDVNNTTNGGVNSTEQGEVTVRKVKDIHIIKEVNVKKQKGVNVTKDGDNIQNKDVNVSKQKSVNITKTKDVSITKNVNVTSNDTASNNNGSRISFENNTCYSLEHHKDYKSISKNKTYILNPDGSTVTRNEASKSSGEFNSLYTNQTKHKIDSDTAYVDGKKITKTNETSSTSFTNQNVGKNESSDSKVSTFVDKDGNVQKNCTKTSSESQVSSLSAGSNTATSSKTTVEGCIS